MRLVFSGTQVRINFNKWEMLLYLQRVKYMEKIKLSTLMIAAEIVSFENQSKNDQTYTYSGKISWGMF